MKSITVLIPAYNEAPVLDALYARLTKLADSLPEYALEFCSSMTVVPTTHYG